MRIIALLNARAGSAGEGGEQARQLRESFSAEGVEADVRAVSGTRLAESARQAAGEGADAVVAAGGDGTASAVAGALAGGNVPMGLLPLGTLNHFAKDLGIPTDLEKAVRVIAAGRARRVDVGEANGRVFINNASIGIYPRLVRQRDSKRATLGLGKWPAMLAALVGALRRFSMMRVRIEAQGASIPRKTPFVLVGNNRYEVGLLSLGARARLDAGRLSLYIADRTGRFGMLRLAARATLGRLEQARDFDVLELEEFDVESRRHRLLVALDGEVTAMRPPLHFRIRPAALAVLTPGWTD